MTGLKIMKKYAKEYVMIAQEDSFQNVAFNTCILLSYFGYNFVSFS